MYNIDRIKEYIQDARIMGTDPEVNPESWTQLKGSLHNDIRDRYQ